MTSFRCFKLGRLRLVIGLFVVGSIGDQLDVRVPAAVPCAGHRGNVDRRRPRGSGVGGDGHPSVASLAAEIRRRLPDIRRIVGDDRRVLVDFDRGGWSPALFADLFAAGFDVLTWRKAPAPTSPSNRSAPPRTSTRTGSGAPGRSPTRPCRSRRTTPIPHRDGHLAAGQQNIAWPVIRRSAWLGSWADWPTCAGRAQTPPETRPERILRRCRYCSTKCKSYSSSYRGSRHCWEVDRS